MGKAQGGRSRRLQPEAAPTLGRWRLGQTWREEARGSATPPHESREAGRGVMFQALRKRFFQAEAQWRSSCNCTASIRPAPSLGPQHRNGLCHHGNYVLFPIIVAQRELLILDASNAAFGCFGLRPQAARVLAGTKQK